VWSALRSHFEISPDRGLSLVALIAVIVAAQCAAPLFLTLPAMAVVAMMLLMLMAKNIGVVRRNLHANLSIAYRLIPIYLPVVMVVFGIILSGRFYFYVLMDIANIAVLIFVIISYLAIAVGNGAAEKYCHRFFQVFVWFGVVIALLGCIKFGFTIFVMHQPDWMARWWIDQGSSLKRDYNGFAQFLFFAMVIASTMGNILERSLWPPKWMLAFLPVAVMVSTSRRGLLLLLAFSAVTCLNLVYCRLRSKTIDRSRLVLAASTFLTLACAIFFLNTSRIIQVAGLLDRLSISSQPYVRTMGNMSARYETLLPGLRGDTIADFDEPISAPAYGSRTERWSFAVELYLEKYSLVQKIFGNGFHYLTAYAARFPHPNGVPHGEDYPHNIFLSALLYSGLVGLFAIFPIVFRVIFSLSSIFIAQKVAAIVSIICFLFGLSGGNTLFSDRIAPLFLLATLLYVPTSRR
jgi:hypothetical protein